MCNQTVVHTTPSFRKEGAFLEKNVRQNRHAFRNQMDYSQRLMVINIKFIENLSKRFTQLKHNEFESERLNVFLRFQKYLGIQRTDQLAIQLYEMKIS